MFGPCFGITPGEVFEDGRRAFQLGNWLEAREYFSRFNEMWPTHALAPRSLYFGTLAGLRAEKVRERLLEEQKVASLSATIKALGEKLPGEDLNEIRTEWEFLKTRLGEPVATPTSFLTMNPAEMDHAIRRGLFPPAGQSPIETIEWARTWLERRTDADFLLKSKMALLKAKALWQVLLAPLPSSVFVSKLKVWGEWPIKEAVDRSLKQAFLNGNREIKREAALLGVCSEYLGSMKQLQLDRSSSQYLQYLRDTGINFSEAWCPR